MIYQLTSIQENLILDDRETGLQCVEVSSKHVNLNMRRNPTGAAGAVIADAGVTLIRNVLVPLIAWLWNRRAILRGSSTPTKP